MPKRKKMEILTSRRTALRLSMDKGEAAMLQMLTEVPIPRTRLQSHLAMYEKRLDQAYTLQDEIVGCMKDADINDEVTAFMQWEAKCLDVILKLQPLATPLLQTDSDFSIDDSNVARGGYQLPKITIPKFSGPLMEWLGFYQSFLHVVDRQRIPAHAKLTLLKQSVIGDAAKTIQYYTITDGNYDIALQALVRKYGDEKKLVDAYIENLLELRDKAKTMPLHSLKDQLISTIHSLEALNITRDQFAIILVPMMRAVLPATTRVEWAKYEKL